MGRTETFRPDWVSPPGETIGDILRERNVSIKDFARQIGHTTQQTSDLLTGRLAITIALARRLERVLGGSVQFWMSRDFEYREPKAKTGISPDEKSWLRELPVADMVRFGWLSPASGPSGLLSECLAFFGVPNVGAWRRGYATLEQAFSFRTSPSFESRSAALAAWLRRGEIESESTQCAPWNAEGFASALKTIRSLTREGDPRQFLPKLQQLCAKNGVAVAIIRAPNGCRASGATRFTTKDKAMLLLSFRHLSDDQFWFSFFHEAGHLMLHGHRQMFIEGEGISDSQAEIEANEFASCTLIPASRKDDLLRLRRSAFEIARFARAIGVSPGVVVGQLQHYGKVPPNHFNRLKRRYSWGRD